VGGGDFMVSTLNSLIETLIDDSCDAIFFFFSLFNFSAFFFAASILLNPSALSNSILHSYNNIFSSSLSAISLKQNSKKNTNFLLLFFSPTTQKQRATSICLLLLLFWRRMFKQHFIHIPQQQHSYSEVCVGTWKKLKNKIQWWRNEAE
jgi:hypothetical protein